MMDKNHERIPAGVAGLCGVTVLLMFALAGRTHLQSVTALVPFMLLTAVTALATALRYRLARLEEEERRDAAAHKAQTGSTLFEASSEVDPFTAARSRRMVEQRMVPFLALVLATIAALLGKSVFEQEAAPLSAPTNVLLAFPFLAAQAFVFFLFSRYLLGLSRSEQGRMMRGPGIYAGLTCLASLIAGIAVAATEKLPRVDTLFVQFTDAYLLLLAAELVLNSVVDLYRPRRGTEPCTSYESRMSRLLTDPASWARSVLMTLDYQFGFKVSETWFFRFLARALIPLLFFQLVTLYALTSLVFVGEHETAVLERLGAPTQNPLLESGAHFKWPWPFETVRRFPVKRVLRVTVGYHDEAHGQPGAILWSVPHYPHEDYFMLASREAEGQDSSAVPVNLLVVNVPVEYRITNVMQYGYGFVDASTVLEQLAYRSVSVLAAALDLSDLMGPRQGDIALALRAHIQDESDRMKLGVEILFVGMQGIHPPVAVAEAFQSVVGALESRESQILEARAYMNRTLPVADADAFAALSRAHAYRVRRSQTADAETFRFIRQASAHNESPSVFRSRTYLDTLEQSLAGIRKYIIAADAEQEVIQFNFEEKLRPDLFDFGSPLEGGR
jgi:regulator of protease activity HflC (stomatin/prohibitin superfamily)